MNENDLASLRGELARLTQRVEQLSNKPPQSNQSDLRVQQLEQRLQKVENWQATMRGESGIEVRGNVIRGSLSPTVPVIKTPPTDVLTTGCLNGAAAVGLVPYNVPPYPL